MERRWVAPDGADANCLVSQTLSLPVFEHPVDLARELGIPVASLYRLSNLGESTASANYRRYAIAKRNGGIRFISAPTPELSNVQRWILRKILRSVPVHFAATAYRFRRSVVDNARQHAGRSIIARIDLEDFFPSIGYERVKQVFSCLGYGHDVADVFARLTTEPSATWPGSRSTGGTVNRIERTLPQGAPTSPALSNIICIGLDARLCGLCGTTYTRYADDLVFSWDGNHKSIGRLLRAAHEVIAEEGFEINHEKTRIMRRGQRQIITGLVVNEGVPSVSRRDIRRFRALLHRLETRGPVDVSERIGRDATSYVKGYIAYVQMVNPEQADRLRTAHPTVFPPGA